MEDNEGREGRLKEGWRKRREGREDEGRREGENGG